MVTSTILACRATLKLEETLDGCRRDLSHSETEQLAGIVDPEASVRVGSATIKIVRLYAPAVIIGSCSIAMLTKSHDILVKRNAALTAAYTALDNGFREYRARVVAKYGEDEDRRFRYGTEMVEVPGKSGKSTKVERIGPYGASIYAMWFDQYNPNWSKDPEYNKLFLRTQQSYLNDLLHSRGHLFLNEVYRELGFLHTQAGSVVGWILHPDNDNCIDLGIFHDDVGENVRDFINGREGAILLDFNVDGVIFDKIDPNKEDIKWQMS
jgi:hypothetical protein